MKTVNIFVQNHPTSKMKSYNFYNVYYRDTDVEIAMEMDRTESSLGSYSKVAQAIKAAEAAHATLPSDSPAIIWRFMNDRAARQLDNDLTKIGAYS